ncbi:hypothetical protein PPL_05765 [Heterostelium album PN500]|uniref:O-methyltransferase domain-containing protein n=1 Tax=Heterostelium pallidum (strain ATCC 26659 / Pp 5 / PN500) TaxID=670386 RepID=D3BB33_HETP5|nr:hypothetical protein PPL_05765 [Heterostelium album PN500]EFA81770.1 hypothetical protein PPL_05765 [Heterostelium album PN500]|eukprot:XP_020433887.1 hypothetical protein PPL_05765 [Heterostelium album PN500]
MSVSHNQRMEDDQNSILKTTQLCDNLEKSRAIFTVCELDVAKHIESIGSKSIEKLAVDVACCPDALYRLMRALSSLGVFRETDARVFQHTKLSEKLADPVVRDIVLINGGSLGYNMWKDLTSTIRKGHSDLNALIGKPSVWEYLVDHHDESKRFFNVMAGYVNYFAPALIEMSDYHTKCESIVGIGGGQGLFLDQILKSGGNTKHESIKTVINYDLPVVIELAKQAGMPVRDARIKDQQGDLVKEKLPEADIFVLQSLVHYNDDNALLILKNIMRSMKSDSRVYIYDFLLDEKNEQLGEKVWFDIKMFQFMNGRERSVEDWERLTKQAGFKITNNQKAKNSHFPSLLVLHKL